MTLTEILTYVAVAAVVFGSLGFTAGYLTSDSHWRSRRNHRTLYPGYSRLHDDE